MWVHAIYKKMIPKNLINIMAVTMPTLPTRRTNGYAGTLPERVAKQ